MQSALDRVGMLHGLGFTDHEARVYVTLLDHPPLKASMLAKLAQIPRNRVYEIVQALQARGLVEIKLGATRTYLAKPLSVFLDRRIEELQARATELSDNREHYSGAFQPTAPENAPDLDVGTTRVLSGRRAVSREIDRMLRSAKKRVIAVGSVGGARRLLSYIEAAGLGTNARRTAPRLRSMSPTASQARRALATISSSSARASTGSNSTCRPFRSSSTGGNFS